MPALINRLVSTQWLSDRLHDPALVILDCTNSARWSDDDGKYITTSGYSTWAKEHIDGSGFADFTNGLSGSSDVFRNTIPDAVQFAKAMAGLGIGDDSCVVLYDSGSSMWAARVWWMLRWIGFDNAAVLDGGFQRWKLEGRPTSARILSAKPATLSVAQKAGVFSAKAEVSRAIQGDTTYLMDALSAEQFAGVGSDLGLSGHIPGAVNLPAISLIDPETGCYLPDAELLTMLPAGKSQKVIVYCGSGIAAASNAFTLVRLGYCDVTIYMPGLQEWVADVSLPLVNGPSDPSDG